MNTATPAHNADPHELAKFSELAHRWWDPNSEFKPLHDINPLRLDEPPVYCPLLPPEYAVMEIKVNERVPYWLTELTAAHNLNMVRMSKYCRSIDVAGIFPPRPNAMLLTAF